MAGSGSCSLGLRNLPSETFDLNDRIEELRVPSEEQALALLALQAPVARDLRQVITGVYLVADLSRMGGLAQHVAKSVRRRHPDHVASGEAEQLLAQMGRVATESAGVAERVLRTRDSEQAAELHRRDDELDALHRRRLRAVPIVSGAVDCLRWLPKISSKPTTQQSVGTRIPRSRICGAHRSRGGRCGAITTVAPVQIAASAAAGPP